MRNLRRKLEGSSFEAWLSTPSLVTWKGLGFRVSGFRVCRVRDWGLGFRDSELQGIGLQSGRVPVGNASHRTLRPKKWQISPSGSTTGKTRPGNEGAGIQH